MQNCGPLFEKKNPSFTKLGTLDARGKHDNFKKSAKKTGALRDKLR